MIEYKIKPVVVAEGEEAKPVDPKDVVIIKTGDEVEFTVGAIDRDIQYLEKSKKELVAEIGIKKATVENVTRTHPHVAAMTPEDLTAAYLLREATGFLNVGEPKLEEINKQLSDYADDKAEIEKQTGIK